MITVKQEIQKAVNKELNIRPIKTESMYFLGKSPNKARIGRVPKIHIISKKTLEPICSGNFKTDKEVKLTDGDMCKICARLHNAFNRV